MTKQDKIKKVMDEFKRGTLKTPDGKVVKNRKQALAIAMSESEDYTEKGELIHQLSIGSVDEAIDILKSAGTVDEDLFEKAHQDGDMHPNGKWVWVSSANGGKGDWRTAGGRTHKKHQATNTGGVSGGGGTTSANKTETPTSQPQKKPKKIDLTPSEEKVVSTFMRNISLSDSTYTDPTKVTLIKTPKGNWAVEYDGHKVATISPQGLTSSIAKKVGMTVNSGTKKQSTTAKGEFTQSVLDAYQYRKPSGSNLNLEDFITDTVKKGGLYYVKIDYHKMTPRQQKEFDAVADKLKNAGWRVEDNGGFGKIIGESDTTKTKTEQKKLRPVGTGTNGPERRRKDNN